MKYLLLLSIFLIQTSIAQEYSAQYKVTFTSNWTSITHPVQFPNGAHFSKLIGSTHNQKGSIWNIDELASDGIEQMAETGGTTVLTGEINTIIANENAENLLLGQGANAVATYNFNIDVTESHPMVSLVTMIAPSPDWFIGVRNKNLLSNGLWMNELRIDLLPYDSGTDDGISFTSSNANSNPPVLIHRITEIPFANNVPLGRIEFELLGTTGIPLGVIFKNDFE
jgi:hypothetical protein